MEKTVDPSSGPVTKVALPAKSASELIAVMISLIVVTSFWI